MLHVNKKKGVRESHLVNLR